ncbi:SOS response-associated peptidase family protein [Paenibacillus filicis]|uniref:Abasic site processing protein n=1 Tax=Paenibacillus filicis TaxID=669464 RepID=A0ABU9DMG4_9BACL
MLIWSPRSRYGGVYGFAGLWDEWMDSEGERLRSFTIITITPNELVEDVHDRMPVILDEEGVSIWLSQEQDKNYLQTLLQPYPADRMIKYPVSKLVGSVKNNSSELLDEIAFN